MIALAKSPENLIPPSEIIFVLYFFKDFLTSITALNCGTPIPATNRVVQIDPGPIPTLTMSTPLSAKNLAAFPVAIFPTQRVEFFNLFLIFLIVINTF